MLFAVIIAMCGLVLSSGGPAMPRSGVPALMQESPQNKPAGQSVKPSATEPPNNPDQPASPPQNPAPPCADSAQPGPTTQPPCAPASPVPAKTKKHGRT